MNLMKYIVSTAAVFILSTPVFGKDATLSGTSFSAPFVAGTASLLWAKNPQLTNREIEAMLLNSAEDMDRTGWDRYNGAGLLNAGKALSNPADDRLTVRFTEVFTNKSNSGQTRTASFLVRKW